jgi:hypothetical protein
LNITAILSAQALRMTEIHKPIYVPDLVDAVQKKYGFVRVPTTPQEMLPADETTPLTFVHGKFVHEGRIIVIQNIQLFHRAIAVDSGSASEDSGIVLDDLLSWTSEFVRPTANLPRMYLTQMEAKLDGNFGFSYDRMSPLLMTLARMIGSYATLGPEGGFPPAFQLVSIGMKINPAQYVLPCELKIERRANQLFESNLYFVQAPLMTDHVRQLLEEYEAVLREAAPSPSVSPSEPPPPSSR